MVCLHRVFQALAGSTLAALLLAAIFAAPGCADVITFSKDSERMGIQQFNEGQYTDAAGSFRNAIHQDPRAYASHYYLGRSYYELGQYQQATQAYKSSLDTMKTSQAGRDDTPFRQKVLDGLALSISKSTDKGTELSKLERDASARQSAEGHFLLAKIFRVSGDADSAIDHYNAAALIDTTNFYIAKEYGLYLEQLGQADRAQMPLRRAYALDSTDEDVVAAMRRVGLVPGPALRDKKDLAKPLVPEGPIPELKIGAKVEVGNQAQQSSDHQSPRD